MDRYERILEGIGDGVLAVDRGLRAVYVNAAAERILGPGAKQGDHAAWARAEAWLPDGSARFPLADMPLSRALRGENVDGAGILVRREGAEDLWIDVTARPIREGGAITGAIAVFRDVTAQRRVQAERAREAQLAGMVRAVGTAANEATAVATALDAALRLVCHTLGFALAHAWTWDPENEQVRSSGVWYADDAARRRPLRDASEPPATPAHMPLLFDAARSGGTFWIPDVAKQPEFARGAAAAAAGLRTYVAVPIRIGAGTAGVLEFFAEGPLDPEPAALQALVQVGTQVGRCYERDRAKASERFVQAVVDHVADPIFVKDRHYRFVYLSRALCEMVGHRREELLGRTDYEFFPKEQADFFRAKDEEMFTREARVVIEEEPITDAHGNLHWLATTKVPMRGERGEVTHLVGVIHDITRMKQAEEQLGQKNAALARQVAETMTALAELDLANRELETFAYTVSHDLRAPLRAVLGYSALLVHELADRLGPEGSEYLQRIEASARRMAQLIDDLLALSKVSRVPLTPRPVDLGAIATSHVAELRARDPQRRVELDVEEGLVVNADPSLIRVVVENLIDNAWKFTAGRDPAHISIGRAGGEVYVRDDGAGFDMAYSDRLFKPFSRLHGTEEYPGTGIGLATVERIVRRHGGAVRAVGEVGKGATFWFRLP